MIHYAVTVFLLLADVLFAACYIREIMRTREPH